MKYIICAIPLLVLFGCSTSVIPAPPPIVPVQTKVVISPDLLKECDNLQTLDKKSYTEGDLLDIIAGWTKTYTICKTSHSALIKITKDAFNTDSK